MLPEPGWIILELGWCWRWYKMYTKALFLLESWESLMISGSLVWNHNKYTKLLLTIIYYLHHMIYLRTPVPCYLLKYFGYNVTYLHTTAPRDLFVYTRLHYLFRYYIITWLIYILQYHVTYLCTTASCNLFTSSSDLYTSITAKPAETLPLVLNVQFYVLYLFISLCSIFFAMFPIYLTSLINESA